MTHNYKGINGQLWTYMLKIENTKRQQHISSLEVLSKLKEKSVLFGIKGNKILGEKSKLIEQLYRLAAERKVSDPGQWRRLLCLSPGQSAEIDSSGK